MEVQQPKDSEQNAPQADKRGECTYLSPLLLHLGVNGSRVDCKDIDVVIVGLEDLFQDCLGVADHGELVTETQTISLC